METITIMRYEGNGQHTQFTRYKEGEDTMHETSAVYTEEQMSNYMEDREFADVVAPFYYSLIR